MKHIAPARFAGWLPSPNPFRPPVALYSLTKAIVGHNARATVSEQVLIEAGFLPPKPTWRYRPESAR